MIYTIIFTYMQVLYITFTCHNFQLFSVLFFLMLYVLGIGSAIALAGALITIISDQFPNWRYIYIVTGTCTFGFCAGIMYCTPVSNISMIIYIIVKISIMNVHNFFFFLNTYRVASLYWNWSITMLDPLSCLFWLLLR